MQVHSDAKLILTSGSTYIKYEPSSLAGKIQYSPRSRILSLRDLPIVMNQIQIGMIHLLSMLFLNCYRLSNCNFKNIAFKLLANRDTIDKNIKLNEPSWENSQNCEIHKIVKFTVLNKILIKVKI